MYPTRRPKTVKTSVMERVAMTVSREEGGDATTKSRHRPSAASMTPQTTKTAHVGAEDNRARASRQSRAAAAENVENDDVGAPLASFASGEDDDALPRRVTAVNAHPNAAGAASAPTLEKKAIKLYPHAGTTSANAEYVYTANASNAVGASLYANTHAAHLTYSTFANAAIASLAVGARLSVRSASSPSASSLSLAPTAFTPSSSSKTNIHATTAAAHVHTALKPTARLALATAVAAALAAAPAHVPAVLAPIAHAWPPTALARPFPRVKHPPLRSATCPSRDAYACAAPRLPKPPHAYAAAARVPNVIIPTALTALTQHPTHACAPRRRRPRPRSLAHAQNGFAIADTAKMKA